MSKPTTLPHKRLVQFDNELLRAIEDFRFANRIKTESEAIRELIRRGLAWNIRHPQATSDTVRRTLASVSRATPNSINDDKELRYVPDE